MFDFQPSEELNLRRIFADDPVFCRIADFCPFNGVGDAGSDVGEGIVVVVDAGQAYHVDARSERVLASLVNFRDQPGSPEKDFSAGLLGLFADFKRFLEKNYNFFAPKCCYTSMETKKQLMLT